MNNKFDYNGAIKFLLDSNDISNINDNIKYQSESNMNSDNHNLSFKAVESCLNKLYEKTRTLEDLIMYSKTFLENQISNTVLECKTLINTIDQSINSIKENSYIIFPIELLSITKANDRDNNELPLCNVFNNNLILSSKTISSAKIKSIDTVSSFPNINNNISDIYKGLPYRTLYMTDRPYNKDMIEKITFYFANIETINCINYNTSNCEIESVEAILENGKNHIIDLKQSNTFKPIRVSSITLHLKCSSYLTSYKKNISNYYDLLKNVYDSKLIIETTQNPYYYYLFGLDKISFDYVTINKDCSFVSKNLKINNLNNNEYITISANSDIELGAAEFYIINGTNEYSICPENVKEIVDEKIFFGKGLRFDIDTSKPVVIKKDMNPINISIESAIQMNDGLYTISYTPTYNSYMIKNILSDSNIKIKIILRSYNDHLKCNINNIEIKLHGKNIISKGDDVNDNEF